MNLKQQLRRRLDRIISPVVSAGMRSYYGDYYYSNKWHPHYALLQDALAETVEYIKSDMSNALIRKDAFGVLSMASKQARLDGLYLEFGVRSGSTINHLARLSPKRTVHGFDSFDGLPEAWSGYTMDAGAFSGEGMPDVASNVELHVGWFDDTLPGFVESHEGPLALAHIDSDIYSSCKTVLDNLASRIVPGSVIVFNEYFNYPNWKQHEYRAFQEFCETHDVGYEYLCWALYEVAVKITSVGGRAS
jgi:hypothetical protein